LLPNVATVVLSSYVVGKCPILYSLHWMHVTLQHILLVVFYENEQLFYSPTIYMSDVIRGVYREKWTKMRQKWLVGEFHRRGGRIPSDIWVIRNLLIQSVEFLRQLSYFTPANLSTRENVNRSNTHDIYVPYELQPEDVVSELWDFTTAYRLFCTCGSMTDCDTEMGCRDDVVYPAAADDVTDSDSANDDDRAELDGASDDLYGAAAEWSTQMKWANYTFVKPCQLLSELSGYPNLTILYSIFCCLAVSSASAKTALSKLKIVMNRFHSSHCDDMLSALLVLASEKDLLAELSNFNIISRLAVASSSLEAHLQHM
jgi:hAT family C-terminal dimerisation region